VFVELDVVVGVVVFVELDVVVGVVVGVVLDVFVVGVVVGCVLAAAAVLDNMPKLMIHPEIVSNGLVIYR